MTKLEAVNRMLRAAGEAEADALDPGGDSPVGIAERVLDDTRVDILAQGWNANTLPDKKVALDTTAPSTITLDPDWLHVDPLDKSRNIGTRNGKLYDLDDDTDQFDQGFDCRIIEDLSLTDLTHSLSVYIVAEAARQLHRELSGEQARDQQLARDAFDAQQQASRDDLRRTDTNIFHTHAAQRTLGYRGVPGATRF